jgi:hypothetical protein
MTRTDPTLVAISSEKVIAIVVSGATSVAPSVGVVEETVGGGSFEVPPSQAEIKRADAMSKPRDCRMGGI